MNPIEQRTLDILNRASEIVRELPNSSLWIDEINKLMGQVHTKCTLAVGGRVKAGKSTFINTLLGEKLAMVGTSETTATVNRFVYGKPADPKRPVKVVYANGNVAYESMAFMNSFQKNDAKTMALAKGIRYFECALENPILKDINLIDTPGTDAVVEEHQGAAERAFGLAEDKELRSIHSQQTKEELQKANAVIYLVGAVATASNKQFLDNFQQACDGASALIAIGVISRIDDEEQTLYNSKSQAEYVAASLREQVSGVLPVSACLYEAVNSHASQFEQWQKLLQAIPEDILTTYLCKSSEAWEGRYDSALLKRCPNLLSADIRRQMKGEMPWGTFRAIIKELYKAASPHEAEEHLLQLANFDEVKRVLDEQFFSRAVAMKCTSLLAQLNKLLFQIRNDALYGIKRSAKKSGEWKELVSKYISPNASASAEELLKFISANVKSETEINQIEAAITSDLVRPTEQLLLDIETANMDYKMLQAVQRYKERFGDYYEELCEIFGMYGTKPKLSNEKKMQRQMFWQSKSMRYMDRRMQEIAAYAAGVYGKL